MVSLRVGDVLWTAQDVMLLSKYAASVHRCVLFRFTFPLVDEVVAVLLSWLTVDLALWGSRVGPPGPRGWSGAQGRVNNGLDHLMDWRASLQFYSSTKDGNSATDNTWPILDILVPFDTEDNVDSLVQGT